MYLLLERALMSLWYGVSSLVISVSDDFTNGNLGHLAILTRM